MSSRARLLLGFGTILAALVLFAVIRTIDPGRGRADSQQTVSKDDRGSSDTTAAGGNGDETASDQNSAAGGLANPNSQKSADVFGVAGPVTVQALPEGRFKSELLKLDDTASDRALRALAELQVPFKDLASLHVDGSGHLFYVCSFDKDQRSEEEKPLASASSQQGDTISNRPRIEPSVSVDTPPVFHSRPGSQNTIFLDFNGPTISGTAWNAAPGRAAIFECLPYDIGSDPSTFDSRELDRIRRVWERVAEAFQGFDVDVTTERPAVFNNRTAHAVITAQQDANGTILPTSGPTLGIAYLGHFGESDYAEKYAVSFTYYPLLSAEEIASTVVHEVGHNLGLSHDGDASHEYYNGHAYGNFWWSPIMGSGRGLLQQWSKGDYYGANNMQDDLAIIGGKLLFQPDDHANVPMGAASAAINGSEIRAWGRIERTSDLDVFSFSAGAGMASIVVTPSHLIYSQTVRNLRTLEVFTELRDANGVLVKRVDPTGQSSLTIDAMLAAGDYTLHVQGAGFGSPTIDVPTGFTNYGSVGSYSIVGTIVPPVTLQEASIVKHPESIDAFLGDWVIFEIAAQGNPATSYQWQKSSDGGASWTSIADGADVDGTSDRILTLKGVAFALDGSRFRCVASNVAGSAFSNSANLKVRAPPVVVTQPVLQNTTTGGSATFTVAASGTMPLSYRWIKDGSVIPGATGASITISNASTADAGLYRVEIRNTHGFASSDAVALGIHVPPEVVAQPVSKSVVIGQSATLEISVVGSSPLSLQWLKDGVAIPGATSSSLQIVNALPADSGKYSVLVTDSFGSITSSVASLFVTPDPSTSRLINISTRAFAGSGGGTLTVGFTIVGIGQKTVVIRGVGPKLADFNVAVVVADPKLKLYKIDGTLIAENDDWESVVAANAGGFSLSPGSKDAALEMNLPPGGYTVQLTNPGALAEGMIEVYDISQDAGSRLVNLSCRMDLAPGQIVIVGTALTGLARPVVVRNSGPGLVQYLTDPDKPNAAADPVLHSFDRDGALVGQNDDWDNELSPYFSVIGAFPLEDGSKDASQRIIITPGLNTVHATAKGEGGIVLIELYESP